METVELDPTIEVVYTLTASDRCDNCGGRAYIRTTISVSVSELLFCAHHGHKYEAKIRPTALIWIDESASILL